MSIQICRDTSDAVALYLPQRLYLKSFAKINVSVQLPTLKVHGKAISNWELMEKFRKMIQPEVFSVLKVSKHSSEVIRFEAELESRENLEKVISRLNNRMIQLSDYPDPLNVRVSEAKSDFPSRHSWDSFFRDATDMDEMKPGERPDTVHIANLPIRWFIHDHDREEDIPSENLFKKVFEKFGSIRQVDVPAADPFRFQMKSTMRGISMPAADTALYFEGYIQFSEYVGFVRCMDSLRGRKLLRKRDDIAEWCSYVVDFDKTKHMTDAAVKRRAIVRERLAARQRAKDEEERQEKEKLSKKEAKERQKQERAEREKLNKMREREETRKKKQLAKLMEKDNVDLNVAVSEEEQKLLKIQKKLQAIRLIEELFKRIELRPCRDSNGTSRLHRSEDAASRQRIIDRMKRTQEEALEAQRERLKQALDGRILIRTALETKKPKPRDSSLSSASSDDNERHKRIKTEKLTTPEREIEYKKAMGMYGMPNPYGFGYPLAACAPGFPYPQTSMYYPGLQGAYYPPPAEYVPRRGWRGRGRGRGMRGRGYYQHTDQYQDSRYPGKSDVCTEHNDRARSRSHSRRRSYTRSRSRSRHRSRSRRRSYSRSHSRGRRSRSRCRSRSRSRRSRSRHTHSRSRSRSKSRGRSMSRSRNRSHARSKSKSRSKFEDHTPSPRNKDRNNRTSVDSNNFVSPRTMREQRHRSKSWSKDIENGKSWSKSPKN